MIEIIAISGIVSIILIILSTRKKEEEIYPKIYDYNLKNIYKDSEENVPYARQYHDARTYQKSRFININDIAEHFNVPSAKINSMFFQLGWVEKRAKWTVATEEGRKNGAEEQYSEAKRKKYVVWKESILENELLKKELLGQYKTTTKKEEVKDKTDEIKRKIEKGKTYEEYVAKVYRSRGYHVTEYGKQKGSKDHGIDLIAKKAKHLVLIQCKNWNENGKWTIDHKDIKAFQTDARTFVEDKPLLRACQLTARYTLSGNFLHPSAIKHIEEMQSIGKKIDYEIVKMEFV